MTLWIEILQLVLVGLTSGALISIGSVGLSISYGVMKFPNIAHGYILTLGSYLAFLFLVTLELRTTPIGSLSFGWSFFGVLVIVGTICGLVGVLLEFILFRPLSRRQSAPIVALIASIGAAIILRGIIYIAWGTERYNYVSGIIPSLELPFGGLRITADAIFTLGLVVFIALFLYVLLYRTKIGKAMRATSENDSLAEVVGINTANVRMFVWFLSGFLAGISGIMYGLQVDVFYNTGFTFLLPIIAATVLGGIGNPWGALAAGLLIGVTQELSLLWIPSGFKTVVPFALLILILLVRPTGLFGQRSSL